MRYSPHDLLPCKHPKEEEFSDMPEFFYHKVIQHLIPDVIRIMHNGIPIDLNKVSELEEVVDAALVHVDEVINNSNLINQFLKAKREIAHTNKREEYNNKHKTYVNFMKPFKFTCKIHRKYFITAYLEKIGKPEEYSLDEWLMKDVKQLNQVEPSRVLDKYIDKTLSPENTLVTTAMRRLAEDKAVVYNKKVDEKFQNISKDSLVDPFNCGSSTQIREFLGEFLGIESEQTSKTTGNPSYRRSEIERILAEVTLKLSELEME